MNDQPAQRSVDDAAVLADIKQRVRHAQPRAVLARLDAFFERYLGLR